MPQLPQFVHWYKCLNISIQKLNGISDKMGMLEDTTSTIAVILLLVVLSLFVGEFATTMASIPGGQAGAVLINNI